VPNSRGVIVKHRAAFRTMRFTKKNKLDAHLEWKYLAQLA
jgi:hypothetical protein